MSLHPQPVPAVPEETARVAHAAFPRNNISLQMRDECGAIFTDEDFAALFPTRGQPAAAPWRLALVTIMQYVEDLSDRQAADAVRSRIDWQYALSLALSDPGFDSTVLSEFRMRLVAGTAEQRLLDALLDACRERQWRTARGRPRTDATPVLARVRAVNRLACGGETLRQALNSLAVVAPAWRHAHGPADWVTRSGRRVDDDHLPTKQEARQTYAQVMGTDGHTFLAALSAPQAPPWFRDSPAVETLRRVWVQQLYLDAGQVRWRTEQEGMPPAGLFLSSPYDVEARSAKKQTTAWMGYKVQVTATCDDAAPHCITQVETTAGPVADGTVTPRIHQALERQGVLPAAHIVETGSLDAAWLVTSPREYGINFLGPTRANDHWHAHAAQGCDASSFAIDWDQRQARCPGGHRSASWPPTVDQRKNAVVQMQCSSKDCQPCPSRAQCRRAQRRILTIRRQAHYQALPPDRHRWQVVWAIKSNRKLDDKKLSQWPQAFRHQRYQRVQLTATAQRQRTSLMRTR